PTTPGPSTLGTARGTSILTTPLRVGRRRSTDRSRSPSRCTTGPPVAARTSSASRAWERRRRTLREVTMSAGDWLTATGTILLAVMLGGLLFALGSVIV